MIQEEKIGWQVYPGSPVWVTTGQDPSGPIQDDTAELTARWNQCRPEISKQVTNAGPTLAYKTRPECQPRTW